MVCPSICVLYPNCLLSDYIRNVSVNTEPADAIEGAEKFTLQYSTLQGEADQWRWYFNSVEMQNNSHYTVGQKSLVIHQPNRNDTGPYTLVLTNPFSTVTFHRNITVLCKKEYLNLALFVRSISLSITFILLY
jgi:hypothetical protein